MTFLCIFYDCAAPADAARGLAMAFSCLEGVVKVIRGAIRIYETRGGTVAF